MRLGGGGPNGRPHRSLVRQAGPSPDLNPIEKMWSKVKSVLREAAAEAPASLFEAIRAAFARIASEDAKGWFESCGYFQF